MMRRFTLFCSAAAFVVVGCAKSDDQATTDTAAGTVGATATPAPATLNLADVAGKWNVKATPEGGTDTTTTNYVLTATADSTGWTITFPNRPKPVPAKVVAVAGDSIIITSGPYESVRRKGVQVTTESIAHIRDGKMTGMTTAHYKTTKADSVLHLRTEGTRAP